MIDSEKISRFSLIAEVIFVESGQKDGAAGYWFADRSMQRIFVTEQDIYERLEKRKHSLFSA